MLSSLNGQLPLPGAGITLDFGVDGSATGMDGCNRYSTAYTVNGSSISFDQPAATTMMACAETVSQQANNYMRALAATDTYELQGSQLTLLKGRQVLATFVSAAQDLPGTAWQVTGYNNGRQAVVSVMLGSTISAAFDENGQVTGNAGCNDYFAAYQTSGNAIQISAPGATRQVCTAPAGIMEQESAVLGSPRPCNHLSCRGKSAGAARRSGCDRRSDGPQC